MERLVDLEQVFFSLSHIESCHFHLARKLIDAFVELEESMAKWRHDHARMVERIIGRGLAQVGQAEWTTWMQQPDIEFSRTCGKLGRYSLNLRIDLT